MDLSKNTKEFIYWLVMFSCFMFVDPNIELAVDAGLNAKIAHGILYALWSGLLIGCWVQLHKAMK